MLFMGIYCPHYVKDKCRVTIGSKATTVSVQVLLTSVLSHNGVSNQAEGY